MFDIKQYLENGSFMKKTVWKVEYLFNFTLKL